MVSQKAIALIVSAVLTDNLVLVKSLGVCPFLGVSSKTGKAIRMGLLTALIMLISAAVCWPLSTMVLIPRGLDYIGVPAFIFIIACAVQLFDILMQKRFSDLREGFGVYLPLIASNCAVLGICTQNMDEAYSFAESMGNAVGGGIGFVLAMFLFSGVMERIEDSDIPESFRGTAINLIAASIVSLAFLGFQGIIDGIFGMGI